MPWTYRYLIILASLLLSSLIPINAGDLPEDITSTLSPPKRLQNDVKSIPTETPASVPSPSPSEEEVSPVTSAEEIKQVTESVWECPNITKLGVECSCDFPHTLRCTGDRTALEVKTIG